MPKYKFRLSTLQKVREARRTQQRQALAEAYHAEEVLSESRDAITSEELELRAIQRSATAGKYLDVNRLIESQRYELLLKARGEELAKQALLLAGETERRRQLLVDADRDVRLLERLDEKHREEYNRRRQRMEVNFLDEAAANRWSSHKLPQKEASTH